MRRLHPITPNERARLAVQETCAAVRVNKEKCSVRERRSIEPIKLSKVDIMRKQKGQLPRGRQQQKGKNKALEHYWSREVRRRGLRQKASRKAAAHSSGCETKKKDPT